MAPKTQTTTANVQGETEQTEQTTLDAALERALAAQKEEMFDAGEFARDRVEDDNVLILEFQDEQANELKIPELAGLTVSECLSNRDFPEDDAVVEVAYASSLTHHYGQWTPGKITEKYRNETLGEEITTYSMPISRLSTV